MSESSPSGADEPAGQRAGTDAPFPQLTKLRGWLTQGRVAAAIEIVAVLPMLAILLEVIRAPRLNFLDYWWVLMNFTNGDGTVNPLGFIRLQNEHFLGIPSLLYWLDAAVFGGDQRFLGVVAVLVTAGTVLLVRAALPKTLSPPLRASIVLATSFITFSLHGLHYFSRGMSGVAWLTANLLVVTALVLAFRGKWSLALVSAFAASVTYGTSFAVWPVLVLVAIVNRESRARLISALVVGGIVAVSWVAMSGGGLAPGTQPANDLGSLIFRYLTLLGHLWTGDDTTIAALAGTAMLIGYAVLVTARSAWRPELRFWWAFALTALLSCGLVALARVDFGAEASLWSRYTSVSVMASVPLLVLTAAVIGQRLPRHQHRIAIAAVAAGVVAFSLGAISAVQIRGENTMHALQAIGIRIGFPNAYTSLNWPIPDNKELTPRLQKFDHYPFNDDFTLGCDGPEIGSTLNPATYAQVGGNPGVEGGWWKYATGELQKVERREGGALLLNGWVGWGDSLEIRCIAVVDGNNKIVGGGVIHHSDSIPPPRNTLPGNYGFTAVSPDTAANVVAITADGKKLTLPVTPPPK